MREGLEKMIHHQAPVNTERGRNPEQTGKSIEVASSLLMEEAPCHRMGEIAAGRMKDFIEGSTVDDAQYLLPGKK